MWHADCIRAREIVRSRKLLIQKGFCAASGSVFDLQGTLDEFLMEKSVVAQLGKRE